MDACSHHPSETPWRKRHGKHMTLNAALFSFIAYYANHLFSFVLFYFSFGDFVDSFTGSQYFSSPVADTSEIKQTMNSSTRKTHCSKSCATGCSYNWSMTFPQGVLLSSSERQCLRTSDTVVSSWVKSRWIMDLIDWFWFMVKDSVHPLSFLSVCAS